MRTVICFLFFVYTTITCSAQHFPQVYVNNAGSGGTSLYIHQSASYSSANLMSISATYKLGVVGITTNSADPYFYNWVKVCLPSKTGTISYGYIPCAEPYMRIDATNNYATVNTDGLNIRPAAGNTTQWVTLNGQNLMFGNSTIVALTGQVQNVGTIPWYEVYLTLDCSQQKGWVSSTYLNFPSSDNYRIVGGRTCLNATECGIPNAGSVNGALVKIGSYGTTYSSSGFYEYKVPIGWSGILTCTHPSYNTSTPSSISVTVNANSLGNNFIMTNAAANCTAPAITSHPAGQSVSPGSNVSFSVLATQGLTPYTYAWEVSTDGGSNWNVITTAGSNPVYSGWTTTTLNLNNVGFANSGYQYRCKVSSGGACGTYFTTSNAAILAVCNLAATLAQAASNIQSGSFMANFQTIGSNNYYTVDVATDNGFQNITGSYAGSASPINVVGLNPQTSYYYRVHYTNGICTSPNSNTIPVTTTQFVNNHPPVASFTIGGANMINAGATVAFTGLASNGPITSWTWAFPGGSPAVSSTQSPQVRYDNPGTYKVTLTACNNFGCNTYSQTGFINVRSTAAKLVKTPVSAATPTNQFQSPEPVLVGTGAYSYRHTDVSVAVIGGKLAFTRFYNSAFGANDGPMGYGWSHSYNYRLVNQQDTLWTVYYPDGHQAVFVPVYQGAGLSFPLYSGTLDSLRKHNSGDFTLYTRDNLQYHFAANGQLVQITDINNNGFTLGYNGNHLSNIVGPGGRSLSLSYTGNRVTKITDPLNRACSFSYDAAGNLQTALDGNQAGTTYTYDSQHRMLTITNPLGDNFITNTYDASGRVDAQVDADNQKTVFEYNVPAAGDATITNPDNSKLVVHHDSLYRKTWIKDEMGYTQSFVYDVNGRVTAYTNQNNVTESRVYDAAGNLLSKTLPGGLVSKISYNLLNAPLQLTDPKGNAATLTYDTNNNPIAVHLPDNTNQYFTNLGNGLRSAVKDGRGNTTTLAYTANGDLASSTAGTYTKNYGYDASGRLTSVTDENGNLTKIVYDNNDNITSIENALHKTVVLKYDENNQLIQLKDRNGGLTDFSYDKKGRLSTRTNPGRAVIHYTYDTMDNLVSVTDPNQHLISYSYDKVHRQTSRTNAAGTTRYEYDGVGNLLKVTDATGKSTAYTYNLTGKVKTVTDDLSNSSGFTYDLNDNLVRVSDPLGNVTAYGYDAMNRLVSVIDATNKTTQISYDENGNKKTLKDPNGHSQQFSYDALNRMTSLLDAAGNTYSYGYDGAGNNTSLTKPTGSITKTFDPLNRVINVANSSGDNYVFTYDDNDNLLTTTNTAGTTTMAYDS